MHDRACMVFRQEMTVAGLTVLRKLIEMENRADDAEKSCMEWEHWIEHHDVCWRHCVVDSRRVSQANV